MKKAILLTFAIVLSATLIMATTGGNLFWVTSTEGTPANFLGGGGGTGEQPSPNVDTFPTPGDSYDWVVFSVGGKIELTGSSSIYGLTGTNATTTINGSKPFIFGGSTFVSTPSSLLYLGPAAIPTNVVDFPSWWEWGNVFQKEIRQLVLNDTVKKLSNYEVFPIPDCLRNLSFQDVETEANKLTTTFENVATTWYPDKVYYILRSGIIDTVSSIVPFDGNKGVKIMVDDQDIVLKIRSLSITGSGDLVIEKMKPNSTGRVFLIVEESFALEGSGKIRTVDQKDDYVFLFYLGDNAVTFGGDVKFYGSVFSKNGNITVSGSSKVKSITSIGDSVTISGAGVTAGTVNAKDADVSVIGGAFLLEGIATGGDIVTVSGGPAPFKYIYAPKAKVSLLGSSQINGTIIANDVLLSGNSPVIGPSYKPIPPACPLIPIPAIATVSQGQGLGWYDYESGQIYTTLPYHKISSNPVKIEAKSGKKVKYPNKSDPEITWQAPVLTFISDLDPTHNKLTLISNISIFESDIAIKDDGEGRVVLVPLNSTAFISFKNVTLGTSTLSISNKNYKYTETIDLSSSTDRAKLTEITELY
jgi:hypothetical protein